MGIAYYFDQLLELIYPSKCVLCDCALEHGSTRGLCEACEKVHPYLYGDVCSLCGKPLIDISVDRCHDCRKTDHVFGYNRSMWVYEDEVQSSLQRFKYHDCKEFGRQFAKELVRYYNSINFHNVDLVVSVPLHKKKLRRRGYNQAYVLAKHFSKDVQLTLAPSDGLVRVLNTKAQKALNDKERQKNMEDAFIASRGCVEGKKILLIDDIYTTGATMDACSRALLEAGAKEVYGLSVAVGRGL